MLLSKRCETLQTSQKEQSSLLEELQVSRLQYTKGTTWGIVTYIKDYKGQGLQDILWCDDWETEVKPTVGNLPSGPDDAFKKQKQKKVTKPSINA
jgi:hypothetical protein